MRLYLDSGFLDQNSIYETAIRTGCSFIIEIGARQVGKTYGTLELMMHKNEKFIIMRRTQTECDFLTNGTINPFLPINKDVEIKRSSPYTGVIRLGENVIGMTVALSTVSKIRGFYGGEFKHLIYDEFIPERHVMKMRYEADAFLNALVTIGGNRELSGERPLMTWLLANSNNIASPILQALRVQSKIEEMIKRGQEYSVLEERGIMIILPHSDEIREIRQRDAITKAIGTDSDFSRMAYSNEFAYNDAENVKKQPMTEYRPVASQTGLLSVYEHKSSGAVYLSDDHGTGKIYPDTERGIKEFAKNYTVLRSYYLNGRMKFESLTVKERFKSLFGF